jgi:hydroxypyruvate isomerase
MAVRKQALWNSTGRESEERLSRAFDACLEAAERTRARYVTVVTGEAAGEPRELQMARFAENLARLAADAQAAGLTFCIEAHAASRTPGMLLRHIGEAYEIACKVNSAAVKLVFDVGHVSLMEGGLVENLVRYADQVAVMQLADMPGRVELGAGSIDFVKLLRTARECGISGPYELEHNLSQAGIVGERRALERLRSIDRILRPGAETTK